MSRNPRKSGHVGRGIGDGVLAAYNLQHWLGGIKQRAREECERSTNIWSSIMPIDPGRPYFLQNTGNGPAFPEYWVTLGTIPAIFPPPPVPLRGGTKESRISVIFKPAMGAPPSPNLYEIVIESANVGRDEATPQEPVRIQPSGATPQVWEIHSLPGEEDIYEIHLPGSLDSWTLPPYGNPENEPPVGLHTALPGPPPGEGGHRWKLVPKD
ncbi:hypothetical protein CTheo_6064 [Ceratobasidium theobromae]|uniref:Uncharacterized protein n=1 Tax=Ceratobasidium theobromae TaxID=1582974 RepID=A0A5N5QFG0_9AGAM|nr:hypothetical protein CTheo_6064 [Ceratobasidium theobromae]